MPMVIAVLISAHDATVVLTITALIDAQDAITALIIAAFINAHDAITARPLLEQLPSTDAVTPIPKPGAFSTLQPPKYLIRHQSTPKLYSHLSYIISMDQVLDVEGFWN